MPIERRRGGDRRAQQPSQQIDVTRIEHENLCGQVNEILRILRRLEFDVHAQGDRIATIEALVGGRRHAS
jgi:hypothetical protein